LLENSKKFFSGHSTPCSFQLTRTLVYFLDHPVCYSDAFSRRCYFIQISFWSQRSLVCAISLESLSLRSRYVYNHSVIVGICDGGAGY